MPPLQSLQLVSFRKWHCLLLLGFLILVVHQKPLLMGDGLEYIVQTQAIVFDHTLSVDRATRAQYWNATNPYQASLRAIEKTPPSHLSAASQAGGNFGGLYPDRYGEYRYYHFWGYSLAVAPLYAVLHLVAPESGIEYYAFSILNALCLGVAFLLALLWNNQKSAVLLISMIVFSPLIPYVAWSHPEIFAFSLTLISFSGLYATKQNLIRSWKVAPILLGIAAAQMPPLVLFFALQAYLFIKHEHDRTWCWWFFGIVIALSPIAYSYYFWGVPNVIEAVGLAKFEFITWTRIKSSLFSPMIGAVWFFPALFLAMAFSLFRAKRNDFYEILLTVALSFGALVLSLSTANVNSSQIGCLRYFVWILAPLYSSVLSSSQLFLGLGDVRHRISAAAFSLLLITVISYFSLWELPQGQIVRFLGSRRALPEVARLYRLTHFSDDPEVLVENIQGRELPTPSTFNAIFLWKLGHQQALWIVPKRALQSSTRIYYEDTKVRGYSAVPAQSLFTARRNQIRLITVDSIEFLRSPRWGNYLYIWSNEDTAPIVRGATLFVR